MNLLPSYFENTEPEARLPERLEFHVFPSLALGFDLENERYKGLIDNKEALVQAIYFMLNTEKGTNPIYPSWYGLETRDLYGATSVYVATELERRIRECLSLDDRVLEVKDFSHKEEKGSLVLSYTILSIFGEIKVRGEELDVS